MQRFTIVIEQDEDEMLIGSAVELPGCHTQARTYDQLFSRMREAIELYLEVEQDKLMVPCSHFVGIQQMEI